MPALRTVICPHLADVAKRLDPDSLNVADEGIQQSDS
jgi:hypothetical protein